MLGRLRYQPGDTIIEVLFAITIFSLVTVGALAIMNQGASTSQRALEITLVRQEIDSQAETLRFLHNSYIASYQKGVTYDSDTPAGQWSLMLDSIESSDSVLASDFGGYTTCPASPPAGSFVLNTRTAKFVSPDSINYSPAEIYSKVSYVESGGSYVIDSTEGIWIEAIRSEDSADPNQSNIGFIDFHIRTCWDSVGLSVPVTIGTIVRLYEPR